MDSSNKLFWNVLVFSYLEKRDLLACREVCKNFYGYISPRMPSLVRTFWNLSLEERANPFMDGIRSASLRESQTRKNALQGKFKESVIAELEGTTRLHKAWSQVSTVLWFNQNNNNKSGKSTLYCWDSSRDQDARLKVVDESTGNHSCQGAVVGKKFGVSVGQNGRMIVVDLMEQKTIYVDNVPTSSYISVVASGNCFLINTVSPRVIWSLDEEGTVSKRPFLHAQKLDKRILLTAAGTRFFYLDYKVQKIVVADVESGEEILQIPRHAGTFLNMNPFCDDYAVCYEGLSLTECDEDEDFSDEEGIIVNLR